MRMTREQYEFHVSEEDKCHRRSEIMQLLIKLDMIPKGSARGIIMQMLAHCAQQEDYMNQDLTPEEYEKKYE